MFLSEFSITHRITVLMMTILILIFGTIAYFRLGLEIFPEMDYPVITILTQYEGASPKEVEEIVTKPLEMTLSTVKNMKSIKSESMEGYSVIMAEFNWGSNLDASAQDLRDLIDQTMMYLPSSVGRPMVMKFDTSQIPILIYGVTGMSNTYELQKIMKDDISNKLKRLKGVASVTIMGGDDVEIQIYIDRSKIEQYNLSFEQIQQAIAMQNINMSGGHMDQYKKDYLIRTIAEYKSIDELENTPVKYNADGSIIRIKDIAEVKRAFKERRYDLRTNKKPTAAFWILKESGQNTLQVVQAVKKELDKIQKSGQYDLEFSEINDMGKMIENTTSDASSNVIFGSILAILIMYIFMRNWRPTLAISLAIPLSVIATFIPLYLMKYSLNLMTLGGLALGVGMLVDNAVVVIENIYRHVEQGHEKIYAAKIGAKEVAMAITASTLTTVAVFLPMVFSDGMTAILIRGLALTVAFSLFVSLFVALTIVPTMASIFFEKNSKMIGDTHWFDKIRNPYVRILKWCLANRGKTVLGVIVMLLICIGLMFTLGAEFMPEGDNPFIMMKVVMPKGTALPETNNMIKQIEDVFAKTEGIENYMTMIGSMDEGGSQADPGNPHSPAEAIVWAKLKPKKDRSMSQEEISEHIRKQIPKITDGEVIFVKNAMTGTNTPPVEIKVFGKDLEEIKRISLQVQKEIEKVEGIRDVQNSISEGNPEIHVKVDRQKAFQYGLTPAQTGLNLRTANQGSVIGIFREGGEEIDIRLRYLAQNRETLDDLTRVAIPTMTGENIPLSQIATIENGEGPSKITHERQNRKGTITANIIGRDLGTTSKDIQKRLKPLQENMPLGYSIEMGGTYEDMVEGFKTLFLGLLLSIVLVYIVMASQFESLKQPFVVMFTVPLAFIGVALALFVTQTTISVASFVGVIVLGGIVVNNGIVLIDYVNQLRNQGIEKHEALIKAGYDRLRPVFITSFTTVIGMLPMAISRGEGSEMKSPMAITIIGGLLSATFLTLVVIPVIYSLVDKISYKEMKK